MAGRSKSRDDLNAIDAGWIDLARELADELADEEERDAAPAPAVEATVPAPEAPPTPPPGRPVTMPAWPAPTPQPPAPRTPGETPAPLPETVKPPEPTPRPRVPTPQPPPPERAPASAADLASSDPDIDDIVASLEPPEERALRSPIPGPLPAPAQVAPPPEKKETPSSRSLMPPYVPTRRPASKPRFAPEPVRPSRPPAPGPELPARPSRPPPPAFPEPPTRLATPPVPVPRTLLAFGALREDDATPTVARTQAKTPLVPIPDPKVVEAEAPALTLDMDEMDNPVRKPSAPRVPIDMSDFASDVAPTRIAPTRIRTPIGMPPPDELPTMLAPPLEKVPTPRPATPDPRPRSPTPDEVVMAPLAPGESVGFEHELDLPAEPGVARDFSIGEAMDVELDALGAVERAAEPESVSARTEREMRERFEVGDFTAALESAEWLLQDQPNHEQAQRFAASCREVLLQMYRVRLGALERVPSIAVGPAELKNLGLDHRAGFVLSCVDGHTSFAEILDLSGMPPLESYRILCDLLLANVIAVR